MRNTFRLAAVVLVGFAAPALAQSSPAQPVMPAQREYKNPNAEMSAPAAPSAPMSEGRAAAPMEHTAPNGNKQAPPRSGANGS